MLKKLLIIMFLMLGCVRADAVCRTPENLKGGRISFTTNYLVTIGGACDLEFLSCGNRGLFSVISQTSSESDPNYIKYTGTLTIITEPRLNYGCLPAKTYECLLYNGDKRYHSVFTSSGASSVSRLYCFVNGEYISMGDFWK